MNKILKPALTMTIAALIVFIDLGCIKNVVPSNQDIAVLDDTSALWDTPDFFIHPVDKPLWFEFVNDSVRQITSPGNAALRDFEPWPFVPHSTGMVKIDKILFITVNRIGFYVVFPWNDDASDRVAVKRNINPEDFSGATVSMPFLCNSKPSVMLYNVDYFSDPLLPVPKQFAWSFVPGQNSARYEPNPIFSLFMDSEIKTIFTGDKRQCYFSVSPARNIDSALQYYSADFSTDTETAKEISIEAFRKASEGSRYDSAPKLLQDVFSTIKPENNKSAVFQISSSFFGGIKLFSNGIGENDDDIEEFSGFYDEHPFPHALVLSADGDIFEASSTKNGNEDFFSDIHIKQQKMPALPEGFVWTSIGFCDNVLTAAWEEKDNWNIGAAGIVFMRYDSKPTKF